MERHTGLAQLPGATAAAFIRLVFWRPPRRWSYSLPVLLVTVSLGTALLVGRAGASDGAFELMLLVVLGVALILGLGPALVAVGVGLLTGIVAIQLVAPEAKGLLVSHVGFFAAEGATLAFIGGVVRTAIGVAVQLPARESPAVQKPFRHAAPLIEPLTPRELEILRAAASGRSANQLADELCLSVNTVKTHLAHCYDKLGAHNRAEAVALAMRSGCLEAADVEQAVLHTPRITREGEDAGQLLT